MNPAMKTTAPSLRTFALLMCLLAAPARARAGEAPLLALAGNDPVMLTAGQETKGKEEHQVTRGRYRYVFANAENQNKFEAAPDKYGIQFDGFCMKMGPLSGRGSPGRWFVSDGRIYLFASESCRDRFKADPAAFTDRADAPPTGTEAEQKRGQELIKGALEGFGGADKVDALKSVRWEVKTVYEEQGQKAESVQATTVVLPDRLRLDYTYGTFSEGHALAGGRLVEISAKNEVTPLPDEVRAFVQRRLYREPLALLRVRQQAGFAAFATGTGEVKGEKVDWLNVGFAGATTKLGIEPKSGRILAVVYRGRAPSNLGVVFKTFAQFKTGEGGLVMPQEWEVTYDGKPPAGPKAATQTVALNVPVEARHFPAAD
jgi:YHS domain-containing protein